MFAQDHAAIDRRRAPAGNGGFRRIACAQHFPHASGGVVRGDALDRRMAREESLALRERDRMRGNLRDALQTSRPERRSDCARWESRLRPEYAGRSRSADRRNGGPTRPGCFRSARECSPPGRPEGSNTGPRMSAAGTSSNVLAQELDGGFFAERAALALKRHPRRWSDIDSAAVTNISRANLIYARHAAHRHTTYQGVNLPVKQRLNIAGMSTVQPQFNCFGGKSHLRRIWTRIVGECLSFAPGRLVE